MSGSPEKYASYSQEVKLGMTGKIEEDIEGEKDDKFLEKSRLNVEKMLKDNEKHSKMEKKYDTLHLKQKEKPKQRQPSMNHVRSEK